MSCRPFLSCSVYGICEQVPPYHSRPNSFTSFQALHQWKPWKPYVDTPWHNKEIIFLGFLWRSGNTNVWPKYCIGYVSLLMIAYTRLRSEERKSSHFIKVFSMYLLNRGSVKVFSWFLFNLPIEAVENSGFTKFIGRKYRIFHSFWPFLPLLVYFP